MIIVGITISSTITATVPTFSASHHHTSTLMGTSESIYPDGSSFTM